MLGSNRTTTNANNGKTMKHSESIKEIAAALPKAQAAIKSAVKGAKNPHFNSRYADLATVIEACREALNSNGITLLQPVRASERGVIVETILLHTSAEWISEELELPIAKQDAQGVGSAITYGKRYGLQSLVGIPSEDDDGNAATAAAEKEATIANAPPSEAEISDALMLLAEESASGMGAVQTTMDKLRPAVQTVLRNTKKAELASIKKSAQRSAEPAKTGAADALAGA